MVMRWELTGLYYFARKYSNGIAMGPRFTRIKKPPRSAEHHFFMGRDFDICET